MAERKTPHSLSWFQRSRNSSKIAVLSLAATTALPSCMFTQWTDRYFLGTVGGPPVHQDHVVAGVLILPFALIGDLIAAPVEAVLLAVMGDRAIYSNRGPSRPIPREQRDQRDPNRERDNVPANPSTPTTQGASRSTEVSSLDSLLPDARMRAEQAILQQLRSTHLDDAQQPDHQALAVRRDGTVVAIHLSNAQWQEILRRSQAQQREFEPFHPTLTTTVDTTTQR